jgi:hypothetical protein
MAQTKKGVRVVPLAQIATYLHADVSRVATALLHLAATPSVVEVAPDCWATVTAMKTPPVIRRGKLLEMVCRDAVATAIPVQTDAHRQQDPGDDGKPPW